LTRPTPRMAPQTFHRNGRSLARFWRHHPF
jgi:hypothetical protein